VAPSCRHHAFLLAAWGAARAAGGIRHAAPPERLSAYHTPPAALPPLFDNLPAWTGRKNGGGERQGRRPHDGAGGELAWGLELSRRYATTYKTASTSIALLTYAAAADSLLLTANHAAGRRFGLRDSAWRSGDNLNTLRLPHANARAFGMLALAIYRLPFIPDSASAHLLPTSTFIPYDATSPKPITDTFGTLSVMGVECG